MEQIAARKDREDTVESDEILYHIEGEATHIRFVALFHGDVLRLIGVILEFSPFVCHLPNHLRFFFSSAGPTVSLSAA